MAGVTAPAGNGSQYIVISDYNINKRALDIGAGAVLYYRMEENRKRESFMIWLVLIPVFLLAAWPALRWMQKANSDDLALSKDDYSLFNSQEGEIRSAARPATGDPDLHDGAMGVRYRSKAGAAAEEKAAAAEPERRTAEVLAQPARQAAEPAAAVSRESAGGRIDYGQSGIDAMQVREQQSVGFTAGLLGKTVGKVMNSPKAVGAILSSKYVISGFMARDTVKAATASPKGLADYLKSAGPSSFINNPIVKAALGSPAVISAVAASGLVSALLDTPAAKALMNDPKALANLVASNPQLVAMATSNPDTLNMLLKNPEVSGIVDKFDTSEIRKKYSGKFTAR